MTTAKIDYLECPHCYANVMFREDGICLSCRKNRHDTEGVKPDETMLNIDHTHQLPCCCFLCGGETKTTTPLSWSYYSGPRESWLSELISHIPGSQNRAIHRISLPVCAACTPAAQQVQPLSVIAGLECRILVHRTFRNQFEQLNGKEVIEWEREAQISNKKDESLSNIGKNLLSFIR